jgi:hypothetical protein
MPYPRDLSSIEKEILNWLLPENISAYKPFHDFMQSSQVIGDGRWGEGNLILDKKNSTIDLTLGMSQVIAFGEAMIGNETLTISVHDFNVDDQLEVQFSGIFPIPENSNIANKWCYSYWKTGNPCPATQTKLREITIKDKSSPLYVLAISKAKKVIWLHHSTSGFNQLIPLTAFYDELLRAKHIRDAKLISHPATFFELVDDFSDTEFRKALFEYNKNAKHKVDLTEIVIETEQPKKSILQKLFGK